MSQRHRHSFGEACLNTATGFGLSWALSPAFYHLAGVQVGPGQNLFIVGCFTVLSVLRSYAWRRAFNWWQHHRRRG